MEIKDSFMLFLKGMFMGICDLIPGISGGTVAFITGIYTRLIDAVKSFSPRLVYLMVVCFFGKGDVDELKSHLKKLDLGFLIVLFLGIGSAILLGSNIIHFLLGNYVVYTLSFFIGLIIASCFIIFEYIKNHKFKNILFGFVGFIWGLLFAFLMPLKVVEPSFYYVFIGGFFAISAMFLPGISGSFILLIMGLYEFMINVLRDISGNVIYFIVFIFGAVLGALVISRLISFLFKKDKCKTLYFLLGIVVGSLVIPVRVIVDGLSSSKISVVIFFVLIGVLLILVVNKFQKGFIED